tara:strand:- start:53 stop:736 length:684 start_codon:yes stop_codon:yes gene_type:complete
MGTEDVKDRYEVIRNGVISNLFSEYISLKVPEEDWDIEGLQNELTGSYGTNIPVQKSIDEGLEVDEILEITQQGFLVSHNFKEETLGAEIMRTFEKAVMLRALDHHWKDHLAIMDQLRQSVNLRGYGQKNPVQEFKRESFSMFTVLLETINIEIVKALCSVNLEQVKTQSEVGPEILIKKERTVPVQKRTSAARKTVSTGQPVKNLKVGRNDPCPCGSGKKYKQCHG